MPDQTPESKADSSPIIQDIRSKDTAYKSHVNAVNNWNRAKAMDEEMKTNTAGPKPEPDEAALRGQEFSEMRKQTGNEFKKQFDKVVAGVPNSFDKLPSIIDKTKNPTEKIVKMSTYLDLASDFLPEISIPGSLEAINRCPEALDLTTEFKTKMLNKVTNLKPSFLRGRTGLTDEIATIVLPFADSLKRLQIIEVSGEAIGTGLFENLTRSQTHQVSFKEVRDVLQQKGIVITQDSLPDEQRLNYKDLEDLLVDEAIKMAPGDMKSKTLGAAVGILEQVGDSLPEGKDLNNIYLNMMTDVVNTSEKIKNDPQTPDLVKQKLTNLRSNMQVKRDTW